VRQRIVSTETKIEYMYILGASHSGSTLLALLLNAHPDIATIGELDSGGVGAVDGYLCSCRRPLTDCPFWQAVAEQMARRQSGFTLDNRGTHFQVPAGRVYRWLMDVEHRGPFVEAVRNLALGLSPVCRRAFAEFARRSVDLVDVVLRQKQSRIFVDSSKHAHRLKYLRRIPAFDIRVLHIVRDGRGVAATYMDQDRFADAADPSLRRGGRGASADTPYALSIPMAQAADEWRRYMRSSEYALAGLNPSRWIEVHYEDLCRDPQPVLRRIFEFAGVDPTRWVRDFRSVEYHILGNGMRLDSTSEIRLDERWKQVLTPYDLSVFDAIAGRINRRYGYV
jgi:hypothetical protein